MMKKSVNRLFLLGMLLFVLWLSCYRGHGLNPPGNVSGIQGRISFVGAWPDSTKEVRVAVLKKYPYGMRDPDSIFAFVITNLAAMSDPVPLLSDQFDFQLVLEPASYAWILVVWLPENLFGIKELGAYYSGPQELFPAEVEVPEGVMVEGIHIVADFANVQNESPFFKIPGRDEKG